MKYNTIQRLALYEMLNGDPYRVEVVDYNEKKWLAFDSGAFVCAFEPGELKIIPPKSEGENVEDIGEYITDDEPSNYLYKTYKQLHYDGRKAVEFKTRDNETVWIDNKYLSLIDTDSTVLVLHEKVPSITIYNCHEESGAVGIVFPLKKEWAERVEALREM